MSYRNPAKFLLCFFLLIGSLNLLPAQLVVTGGQTSSQLANNLVGNGILVFNETLVCPGNSYGIFDGSNSNIGLNAGVLLTTGDIINAIGPNLNGAVGTDNFAPGDADLNNLLFPDTTNDACVLEFDMIPSCDTIQISYVFGSDEYDEFVCSEYNDIFAFFISGPGLVGVQNIAIIPGTAIPVAINNVNVGVPGAFANPLTPCITAYSAFFVSNNNGATVEYDGFTTPLLAKTPVIPCSTYHIKLAVADGVDWLYDSGVFLEQGGIRCSNGNISVNTSAAAGVGLNTAVEGCVDGTIFFRRTGDLNTPVTINITYGGSATPGVDYAGLPSSINFPALVDSVGFTLNAFPDLINEGIEDVLIIVADSVCGFIFGDTATLFISDPPETDFSFSAVCLGDPVSFTDLSNFPAGPILSWNWDFGDGNTSSVQNPTHTYSTAGSFVVTLIATTAQGCADTLSQSIDIYPVPTADFNFSGLCEGETVQFSDLSSSTSGISSWAWDFGDGNNSTLGSPSHSYAGPGTYSVSLTVVDVNGCSDTEVQNHTVHPLPVVDFSFQDVCDGETVSFSDLSSANPVSWVWDFGDGSPISTLQNPNHVFPAPGIYTVDLTVTSNQNCSSSASRTVTIHPNPVADFSANAACYNDTSRFTDLSSILSGNIVSWTWDLGDGNSSNLPSPTHVYSQPGQFPVTLTVISDQGCTDQHTQLVTVSAATIVPITLNDSVCKGFDAFLQVRVPAGHTIFWYYVSAGGNPFFIGENYRTQPLANTVIYYVEIETPQGCRSNRFPVIGHVFPPQQPGGLLLNSREVEIPNAIVEFGLSNPVNISSYTWLFGDGGSSQSPNPIYQYNQPGIYDIRLQLTDIYGCEYEYFWNDHITVTENVRLFVPTGFSPNSDETNDYFSVSTRLISDFNIVIYDRWGKLIYQSQNASFAWDGKDPSGQPLPEGTYVWNITASTYDGKAIQRSGSITLIR